MTTVAPSAAELRAAFDTKPSEYKVSPHPTRSEILKLRRITKSNLQKITCLIPGTEYTGWSWIIYSNDEWNELHQRITPTNIPPYPNVTNPHLFTVDTSWTSKALSEHKTIWEQSFYLWQYKSHLEQACLLDLTSAIPPELIADLKHDDILQPFVSVTYLLNYMETQWSTIKPNDILRIMTTLNTPFDDTITMAQYFNRQQKCQSALKDTLEPISEATMIRVALGHFERHASLTRACREWTIENPPTTTPTWTDCKSHFLKHYTLYHDEQLNLQASGLANSAYSDDITSLRNEMNTNLRNEMANIQAYNESKLTEKDNQIAFLIEQVQHLTTANNNKSLPTTISTPPTEATSTASTISDIKSDLTAFITKEIQQATKITNAAKNAKQTAYHNRTKRYFNNDNYCWTHGCDLHLKHTSKTCKNRAPGHKEEATLHNRMGGSTRYLDLVTQ